MDDALGVGKLQALAGLHGDAEGVLQGELVVGGLLDEALDVAALHEFADHVGLVVLLAQVEDGDDVGVGAEAAHGLGLALDAGSPWLIQAVGLDEGEGDVAVEQGVVGEVDALLAALAEEAPHDVAPAGKGGGEGRGGWGRGGGGRRISVP